MNVLIKCQILYYTVVTTDTILSYIVNIKLIILHVKYQIKKITCKISNYSLALIVSSISKQDLACIFEIHLK